MIAIAFSITLLSLSICLVGMMLVQTYDRYMRAEAKRRNDLAMAGEHWDELDRLMTDIVVALARMPVERVEAWHEQITGHSRDNDNV